MLLLLKNEIKWELKRDKAENWISNRNQDRRLYELVRVYIFIILLFYFIYR
jgi:hypothetical protein